MKIKKTSMLAAGISLAMCASASAASSLIIGLNDDGDMRIINTSTGAESILSITLSFTDSDTFFDTHANAPGTTSQPFSSTVNAGGATVAPPNDEDTDGDHAAAFAFGFGTFTSGGDVSIGFDLDRLSDLDGTGDASTASFSILMFDGVNTELVEVVATGSGSVGGESFDYTFTTVPEPSSLALGSLGLLSLCLRRRRVS